MVAELDVTQALNSKDVEVLAQMIWDLNNAYIALQEEITQERIETRLAHERLVRYIVTTDRERVEVAQKSEALLNYARDMAEFLAGGVHFDIHTDNIGSLPDIDAAFDDGWRVEEIPTQSEAREFLEQNLEQQYEDDLEDYPDDE